MESSTTLFEKVKNTNILPYIPAGVIKKYFRENYRKK